MGEMTIAERAAAWWAGELMDAHAEKRVAFRAALIPIFEEKIKRDGDRLERAGYDRMRRILLGYVDYDPDEPLLAGLRAVGVDCQGCMFSARGVFRYEKTGLAVRDGVLCTKSRYGAPWEPLPEATDEEAR